MSRIVKRRPLAKGLCDGGRVKVNGHIARAGKEIKVGDEIEIRFGRKTVTLQVLSLPEGAVSKKIASEMYLIIREEKADPLDGAPQLVIDDEEN
jgi:ribosomal 50S subunit-recycling heat shock protein